MEKFLIQITPEKLEQIIEDVLKRYIDSIKDNEKEYLSYQEAAKLLDLKPDTIRKRVKNGLYKKHINGGSVYVKRSDIMKSFK